MKINNKFFKLFFVAALISVSGCETIDLDQTENPSAVSQNLLDPVLAFNYVQLQLPDFVNSANGFTQEVTRQMAMTGGNTYDNAFAPINFNGNWSSGYNILLAVQQMEPKALATQQYYALGASKVIRAYVLMTMVDMYGDIPYSQALQVNGNLTPAFDSSASVYTGVLNELDAAIAMLGQNSTGTAPTDLYYSNKDNWVTLAKTLKLKMYTTARLAGSDIGVADIGAAINAIVLAGDYIDNKSEDFAFRYGNQRFNPNTRHPLYNDQYELGGGAYIGNYMMWSMTTEKGFPVGLTPGASTLTDPRINFYFYKQDADPSNDDAFTLPKKPRPDHYNSVDYDSFYIPLKHTPFIVSNWTGEASIPTNGFWGRDHGDNSGIPPDNDKRTVAGIYPIGGAYGNPGSVQTSGNKGALGAGIMPILLSSYVHFMLAEDILTAGVTGNARTEFKTGMEQSIDKVINFNVTSSAYIGTQPTMTALVSQQTAYVNFELAKYDALASTAGKLELIIKEYYIAAWGNGIEPYNNYRRTGYPSNFQPTLEPLSGVFFYTALYPGSAAVNNPNTPANVRTRKVFWDKANITLH